MTRKYSLREAETEKATKGACKFCTTFFENSARDVVRASCFVRCKLFQ